MATHKPYGDGKRIGAVKGCAESKIKAALIC
jgi:hypothetical protein